MNRKRMINRIFAIMIAMVLMVSGVNVPQMTVRAADTQISANSASDAVKATIVENASNQYWYEYNITVANNSSQSICGWVIKAYLPNVDMSGASSWDTCKLTYESGYLYIEGVGDGSVVPAGGDNSTYQVKFGLGRNIGLDTSDIESITYEYGSEANTGTDEFEFNYILTGETKDLAFEDTPVGRHGKLHVDGLYLCDENNEKFQLRGASLHGIQWDVGYNYINKGAFQSLRDEWGINAIRLPVYVTQNGYTEGAAAAMDTHIQNAVNYATELGMYVLIDWHVHSASGETTNPNTWKSQANTFFDKYANMYKNHNNVLFEICNEPVNTPWYDGSGNDLYSYANSIIPTIRQYTDAVVIVGTNTWSQDVDSVAAKKLSTTNTMYTIHFYSATHMDNIRSKVSTALSAGVPVFCTEFGVCSADGNGSYNLTEADKWMDLFDENNISYFCWQLSNKNEKSSYLSSSSTKTSGGWVNSDLSTTGMWLINENRPKAEAEEEKYASLVETSETAELAITGTFDYEQAYEILELTNAEREKVGLSPLTMDKDLLDAAMIRAAESAVNFDHTRPNGEDWRSLCSKMYGENIAVNYSNAEGAVNQWMNSTSGHKEAILNSSFDSIGIGVFYQDGYKFYVQNFGFDNITAVTKPNNVEKTIDIEVQKSSLKNADIAFTATKYSVVSGNTKTANVAMTNLDWASADVVLDPSNFTYTMGSTAVATVNNGVITPVSNGSTTLTATLKADSSKKISATVNSSGFVESVSLNKSTLTLDTNGTKTATLTATVGPTNATDKTVSWKSSNTSVATVSSAGVITAVAPGTATITATTNSGNKTATCAVTVYKTQVAPAAPTKKSATSDTIVLNEISGAEYSRDGKNWQTSTTFTGLTANTEYTFYARMAADGEYIKVSSASTVTKIKTLPVYVTSVALDKTSMKLQIGGDNEILTGKLTASVKPDNATTKAVTWKSSDTKVATVDASGNVKAVGPGSATITVQATGGERTQPSAACTVTVWKTPEVPTQSPSTSVAPTEDTITLTPYSGCEYRIVPDGKWQDSNIFTGLKPGTEYTFEIRVKGDSANNINPGESVTIKVSTPEEAEKVIAVTGVKFDSVGETYSITMGDKNTWTFASTVSPANATNKQVSYASSAKNVATINGNGIVTPVAPGKTKITVTTVDGGKTDSFELSVFKKYDTPSSPTLASKTTTTVTLNKVDGCKYSKDGVNWQDSNIFTGLTENTKYTFYIKKVSNGYWLESDKSAGLSVTTEKETSGTTGGTTGGETGGTTGGDTTGGTTGGETGGTTGGDTTGGTTGGNAGGNAGDAIQEPFVAPNIKVSYRTHIQTFGWEGKEDDIKTWKSDGTMSGTSGKAKRLEGINVVVEPTTACDELDLGIQYTTHCQSYGWLPWSADGDMNGTEGESKRLEAIMIQLTGEHAEYYDVYYRVHAQTYGWLGWASNGAPAGTAGYAKRLEGIQIVVVKKGENFDKNIGGITSKNTKAFEAKAGNSPIVNYPATSNTNPVVPGKDMVNVAYRTHVQKYGWQGWKYNGQMSGTSGEAKRLEGIEINVTNKDYEGGIAYCTHVQTYGWQGADLDKPSTWKQDGDMAGTSGEAKRLEAICITLTGEMAEHYDIYYRVHAQSYGWLGWASNGAPSGTAGYAKRLEGIQIVIVPKGGGAPANTYMGVTSKNPQAYIEK